MHSAPFNLDKSVQEDDLWPGAASAEGRRRLLLCQHLVTVCKCVYSFSFQQKAFWLTDPSASAFAIQPSRTPLSIPIVNLQYKQLVHHLIKRESTMTTTCYFVLFITDYCINGILLRLFSIVLTRANMQSCDEKYCPFCAKSAFRIGYHSDLQ